MDHPPDQVTLASRITSALARGWSAKEKGNILIWSIIVVLLVLWLLGLVTGAVGSLIHGLLALAAIVFLYQFVSGRRTV